MPESRDEVRIFRGLPVPVVVRVAVRVWHRYCNVSPCGLASCVAGVARGRPRSPEGSACNCSGQDHPPLAARPKSEQKGLVAHLWRARVRWGRDSSAGTLSWAPLASAWGVRCEAPTPSRLPVLAPGGLGLPPTHRGRGCADAGARRFGARDPLGVVCHWGGVRLPRGRGEGRLGSGALSLSAAHPGGG